MKKVLIPLSFLLSVSLALLSCGGSGSSTGTKTSGVAYRAFITNSVSSGSGASGVFIINAQTDARAFVSPISAGNTPGMMVLTPNRAETLVFSGDGTRASDNQFTIINNATESAAGHVTLPGLTESFVVSPDSSTAYVAMPTASVVGQSPGVVDAIALTGGSVTGQVTIPAVRFLSIDNGGNRILAFSDNLDSVAVITPSNIGTNNAAATFVTGFDRPVWAFFSSDDKTAYVLNCGAECGGTQASIQTLDLTAPTLTAGPTIDVPAATVALVNNSTVYLAGTPVPNPDPQPCTGQTTQATSCGLLTILDLTSGTYTSTPITDGYHNHLALGANGQLFIGARTCTEIALPNPTNEVRGCLSIYNTQPNAVGTVPAGGVVIPPANGDVTGIQSITKRTVVYVVQGGAVNIYDTATDVLETNPNDPNHPGQIYGMVGQFIDVKTPDF